MNPLAVQRQRQAATLPTNRRSSRGGAFGASSVGPLLRRLFAQNVLAAAFWQAIGLLSCWAADVPNAPGPAAPAPAATITVRVDQPGAAPTQIGIFFEDINFGGDGGLYPERVKNRSFEFTDPLRGWTPIEREGATGARVIKDDQPLHPNNPHYLRLTCDKDGGGFGLANEGFFGIGLQENAEFVFSVHARSTDATPPALLVELEAPSGAKLAAGRLSGFTGRWQKHTCVVRATATTPKARLNVLLQGPGSLDLDLVSLFPRNTWKGRANGLRPDVVQLLADLKPAFLRFPGGCIVEGRDLSKRYQWKTTLGELTERRLIINRWNDEFKHRPAPDYFQSFGLGFYEYFLLCEDLGAKPLPILNCGMACQFNTGELVPLDQLDPYLQDALDLIEFANGPTTSAWGRKRVELGHPAPFKLTLLGVGNEQWGPAYIERYAKFAQVLKARHPDIQLVSSAGPRPADELFHFAWPKLRALKADIVDEHCYDRPDWFFKNAGRYDHYDRQGPKVFMGEYAAQSVQTVSPDNRNNWECALAEAAYLTGLERNGEVVVMASYAPLLAHVEGWQWTPNLIWFDNLRSYGTPSYYVQQLFANHRGTRLLPVSVTGGGAGAAPTLFASAARDDAAEEVILKLVNAAPRAREVRVRLTGLGRVGPTAQVTVLASEDLQAENSLEQPRRVAPLAQTLAVAGPEFTVPTAAQSVTVIRLRGAFD
jgi:alpha-N-arabinofuranosidase